MRERKESDMVDALAELHGKRTLIKDRVRAGPRPSIHDSAPKKSSPNEG